MNVNVTTQTVMIGTSRDVSEAEFRDAVRERLREQISEHSGSVSG